MLDRFGILAALARAALDARRVLTFGARVRHLQEKKQDGCKRAVFAPSLARPVPAMRLRLSRVSSRRLAATMGWGRIGLGAAALLIPRLVLRPWVGDRNDDAGFVLLGRALGARDLVLGTGAVLARRHQEPLRWWVAAGGGRARWIMR